MAFISNLKTIFRYKPESNKKDVFHKNNTLQLAKDSDKKRISIKLKRNRVIRVELEMDRFKSAVSQAENIDNPNRLNLLSFYKEILKDAHLLSQIRTAHYTVQQSKFIVTDGTEKEVPELHNLFETQWFTDFMKFALDVEFYGHSLLELQGLDTEFSRASIIPREHVVQEQGIIKLDISDTDGIEYRPIADQFYLLELGDNYSLGLLEIAAREVILKNYARTDWSRASEKYGMPLLSIRTDATNQSELDNMENMAINFGSNGYVILNKEDEIEIKSMSAGDSFYKVYEENANFCDANISKLINGQTMTSDDGSSYSQANVHERILNDYTRARLQRIQNMINDKLFPFLIYHGYKLEGKKLIFSDILNWYADKPTSLETDTELKKKSQLLLDMNEIYNI